MNILALVESAEHVCYRYRIAAFAPALRGAGHELVVQPLHRKLAGRVRQFWAASDHDTVIVQRKLLPGWQWALLRRRARRLVFDVDDALMHRDSYHPKGVYDAAREARFARVARECDALLLGNDFLRGRAIDAGARASRALFLPTCIDLSKYKISDHTRRAGGLRLVWVGSSSTLKGLEQSAAIWAELGRRHSWLALRLVSDRFARFGSLVIEDRAWSEKTEAGEIAGSDAGIAWMPDDDWSRGKCGLKLLQYMAAGLPVVANPVGVHREMVRDGETGFLADSVDDWSEALVRLRDPGLRARMGAAGRSLVERCYSTSAWERSFVEAVTGRAEVGADSQARPRRRLLPPQAASGAGPHGAKFRNPADGLEARSTGGAP